MSIEALWAVRFGIVQGQQPARISGGIVVFETNRIFGGDTWTFYTGSYQLAGNSVTIRVDVGVHFTENGESIFGGPLRPYTLNGKGTLNSDHTEIVVTLEIEGDPGASMLARLERVQALP